MDAEVETRTPAITITGPEPMTIDPTEAKRRPTLTADEARLLTQEILRTTSRLWLLVTEAHDRSAHFALGYETWNDYARAELGMSPSRSYQLLDTGHVMRELAAGGIDIDRAKVPTARVVARVKDRLPQVRKVARQAVKEGTQPDDGLKALAREVRVLPEPTAAVTRGRPDGRRNAQVKCPACDGKGKVARAEAGRLRTLLKAK